MALAASSPVTGRREQEAPGRPEYLVRKIHESNTGAYFVVQSLPPVLVKARALPGGPLYVCLTRVCINAGAWSECDHVQAVILFDNPDAAEQPAALANDPEGGLPVRESGVPAEALGAPLEGASVRPLRLPRVPVQSAPGPAQEPLGAAEEVWPAAPADGEGPAAWTGP